MRHIALTLFACSTLVLTGCPSDEPEVQEDAGVSQRADAGGGGGGGGDDAGGGGGVADDAGGGGGNADAGGGGSVDDDAGGGGGGVADAGVEEDAGDRPVLRCGNGEIDEGEECDDGNNDDTDACQPNCTLSRCGDGVVRRDLEEDDEGYEACDDGNDVPGDGIDDVCDPDCTIVDAPEADDHGDDAQTASAIEIGVPVAGQLDAGDDLDYFGFDVEQEATHDIVVTSEAALGCRLEDALANPQDEQSSDPEREGRCEMVARLEADQRYYVIIYVQEGNLTTYSVTITARDEARCGNGVVELGEDCDLGPDVPGDGCDAECRFAAQCGNGVVEAGEECDREGPDCVDCRVVEVQLCGNNRIDDGENCDDGGNDAGDGCDAECQIEGGGNPQCGNAILERGEACDDGVNGNNEDGCDDQCQLVGNPNDDHGDERADATRVAAPSTTDGVIEVGNDVDWFQFTLDETGVWDLHTTGNLDTRCWLYDADGDEVAYNDDIDVFENVNCGIVRRLDAGTWYVRVESWNVDVGNYTLMVAVSEEPVAEDDHSDEREGATEIAIPSNTDGNLEVGGDVDMFMFRPAEANRYRVNTSGDLDTYCRVLDEDGESLAGNDDAWDIWDPELPDDLGVNCGIVVDLAADTTYYFKVEGLHGGVVGAYGVHIELFPWPDANNPCDGVVCQEGEVCQGGMCVRDDGGGDPCADVDCPQGQMCVNGECIEGNGEVDPCEDVDCPQGQICQDGGCFDEGDEFDPCEDVVCEQGQVCRDGGCMDEGDEFDPCQDVVCQEGQTCERGNCVDDDG